MSFARFPTSRLARVHNGLMSTLVTPPPVGPLGVAIRCALQGEAAFAGGQPLNACPYGDVRPFSRRAWLAGYCAGARKAGARLPDDVVAEVDDAAPWPGDTSPAS